MAKALSLFGAGRLGQTLARLWQQQGYFSIQQLLTRSHKSAQQACRFIGLADKLGHHQIDTLEPSKLWLLACPDSELAQAVEALQANQLVSSGGIVFHCSGALNATLLAPLRKQGVHCASVHPVHSFAKPGLSVQQFSGSYCACEGEQEALAVLQPAFSAIGGQCFDIQTDNKLLYHAGSVMACNNLVALLQASLDTFKLAGIEQQQALDLLAPLLQGTLDNVLQHGPVKALTGPIARGDSQLVQEQFQQLNRAKPELGELYRQLGLQCLALAKQAGLDKEKHRQLEESLS